jgi:2',3'-cyclic-nucleotide 2'-phosphodiesterase (5'-nucleotidase family)
METNIYAITDSHQESRNLSRLLSGICTLENSNKSFLLLDSGDLFKGIYDRELSVGAYLKLKQLRPKAQIFITLGNNDFGFKKSDFEYLKSVVFTFKNSEINVLCANLVDKKSPNSWVDSYKIIDINGEKVLITGFCLNNSCAKKFGCELLSPEETFEKLIKSVDEKFDKIFVLNHHWYIYSKALKDFAIKKGMPIDLIIGGHEHSPILPDYENNIFYPLSFARTMYKFTFDTKIKSVEEIKLEDVDFMQDFEEPILKYEQKTGLKKPIAKRVLNLTKKYSDPCPLGTFISDNMKKLGQTEIAFHSTGFTMYPLRLADSDVITNYDIERVICAGTTIERVELTVEDLKKVFQNATRDRMFRDRGNSRFLQCSRNITITGKGNSANNTYEILQIAIDEENLLDGSGNAKNPTRKISCTIDSYIGTGEQGFSMLKDLSKERILLDGKEIKLNEMFLFALLEAEKTYKNSSEYPSFKIIEK